MQQYCMYLRLLTVGLSLLFSEMPGLKLLRRKTCTTGDKPLKGARIVGCTHVTAKSAVSTSSVILSVKNVTFVK